MTQHILEGFQLSPQQKRIWRLDRERLFVAATIAIDGPVDSQRLEKALQSLIARHEILRTAFATLPGMDVPVQQVHEQGTLELTVYDSVESDTAAALLENPEPFDVTNPPLLRCRLLRHSATSHTLELVLPALCADAGSLCLFFREIAAAYAGNIADATDCEEPLQYADFAEWQYEVQEEEEGDYWKRLDLPDSPAELDVEQTCPEGTGRLLTARRELPADLVSRIETFTEEADTFWFTAWLAFLSRHCDDRAVMLYRPFDSRLAEPLDTAPGPVDKSVPLFYRPAIGQSFAAMSAEIGPLLEEADEHGLYLDWDALPRQENVAGRSWGYERRELPEVETVDGIRFRLNDLLAHTELCNIKLHLTHRDGIETLVLAWRDHVLPRERAERLLEGFQTMVDAILRDPNLPIERLPILGEAERTQLTSWNRTDVATSEATSLQARFEAAAGRAPEVMAIRFGDHSMTYSQLDKAANRLAHALRAAGIGPECVVPLVAERSIEAVIGMLAVLKAGGAFAVIDPRQPQARVRLMLDDMQAPVILTRTELSPTVGDMAPNARLVAIEAEDGHPDTPVPNLTEPEHAAYLIYTSGSTGTPKAAMVNHGSVLNLANALQRTVYHGLEGTLRVSLNAPLVFDASVKQWLQLLEGHTLVVVPDEVRPDGQALLQFIETKQPDVLDLTPAQVNMLLHAGLRDRPEVLPKRVLIGGEALAPAAWEALRAMNPEGCFNVYGPTECTDVSTLCNLNAAKPHIGKPLANVRLHVLDNRQQPVSIGAPGELCIAGAGLARGYLKRGDLTAGRWLPLSLSETGGARLYRTGDRVRFDEDGNLHYHGRLDHQLKLRGFRVEPGEIEAALRSQPGVHESVVTVRDYNGDRRLIAYVVPGPGQMEALKPEALREAVRDLLPDHMVPRAVVVLERLPLTRNGKVDRKALPEPTAFSADIGDKPVLTPIEDILWDIWADVLGPSGLGPDKDFFALGGHSLLATRLVSSLRKVLDVELSLRVIFNAPTIRLLAREVEAVMGKSGNAMRPPAMIHVPREGGLPMSFAQQRLWFVHQVDPNDTSYNAPVAFRVTGRLNMAALEKALNLLVARHEILRTRFAMSNGQALQFIEEAGPVPLPLTDLSEDPEAEKTIATPDRPRGRYTVRLGAEPTLPHPALPPGWGTPHCPVQHAPHHRRCLE